MEGSVTEAKAKLAQPVISIGMPVLNAGRTIRKAIASILWQSFPGWELILIDDGSTDDTRSVVDSFADPRIKVVADGSRIGLAARLNETLSLAQGQYFARMDGDDVAYPQRLERQLDFLETHPDVDLLGTGAIAFDGTGQAVGTYPMRQTHEAICARPWAVFYLAHPTWMGRAEWFGRFKYRPDLTKGQDQELLLRSFRQSRFQCLPEILLGYRVERVSIKKTMLGRYAYCRALIEQAPEAVAYTDVAKGVAAHLAKGAADVVGALSRRDAYIVRRRMPSLDRREVKRWQEIWAALPG